MGSSGLSVSPKDTLACIQWDLSPTPDLLTERCLTLGSGLNSHIHSTQKLDSQSEYDGVKRRNTEQINSAHKGSKAHILLLLEYKITKLNKLLHPHVNRFIENHDFSPCCCSPGWKHLNKHTEPLISGSEYCYWSCHRSTLCAYVWMSSQVSGNCKLRF